MQIKGDAGRLEEVLNNLISNAIRYSGSNQIEITSVAEPDRVCVTVTDFGIGISAEHLPHLFERFYRVDSGRSRKTGGSGLGLAIVKNAVQFHGGSVSAVNDHGLKFTIRLPRYKA